MNLRYVWLVIGGVLLFFFNGKWMLPIAAWIAPVFLIRFFRESRIPGGLAPGFIIMSLSFYFTFHGIIPFPAPVYLLLTPLYGLYFLLPYIVDRLFSGKVDGLLSTLVFPLAYVTLEYLTSLFSPFSTWGSLAYTQYGNLPLMQILNITGIWGLVFLVTWFPAVVNWCWEQGFAWNRVRPGIVLYTLILRSGPPLRRSKLAVEQAGGGDSPHCFCYPGRNAGLSGRVHKVFWRRVAK